MRKKHIVIAAAALCLLFVCAACQTDAGKTTATPTDTPTATPTPTQIQPPDPTPDPTGTEPPGQPTGQVSEGPVLDGDDFPDTLDITVNREGFEETLTGTLVVSDLSYAIYLLPGFTFTPTDDGDIIHPAEGSELLPAIQMKITRVDPASAQPEDIAAPDADALRTRYQRVTKGAHTFEVMMTYPLEAAEGGAVLLEAMWNTLRTE